MAVLSHLTTGSGRLDLSEWRKVRVTSDFPRTIQRVVAGGKDPTVFVLSHGPGSVVVSEDVTAPTRTSTDLLSAVPHIVNFVSHEGPLRAFHRRGGEETTIKRGLGINHVTYMMIPTVESEGFHRNFIKIRADRARLELSLESRRKFCISNLPVFASTSRQGSRVCERPILLEPTPGSRTGAGGFTTHGGSSRAFPPFFPGSSPRSTGGSSRLQFRLTRPIDYRRFPSKSDDQPRSPARSRLFTFRIGLRRYV